MALRRLLNMFTPSQPEIATPPAPHDGQRDYEMERRRAEEELRAMQLQHEQRMREILESTCCDEEKRKREEEERRREHEMRIREMIEGASRDAEKRKQHEEARILADREDRRREMEAIKMKDEEEKEEMERVRRDEKRRWNEKRALDEEMDQSRWNYDEASKAIREQNKYIRDTELHRISLERKADREEFEEKLRCDRERIAQSHEELRNEFRTQTLIEQQMLNSDPDRSGITMKLALLKEELEVLIEIMVNEVGEMQNFAHERPNAKFLTDIEKCAAKVAEAATNFHSLIEEVVRQLNSEHVVNLSVESLIKCTIRSDELGEQVNAIPTVIELKEKYGNH